MATWSHSPYTITLFSNYKMGKKERKKCVQQTLFLFLMIKPCIGSLFLNIEEFNSIVILQRLSIIFIVLKKTSFIHQENATHKLKPERDSEKSFFGSRAFHTTIPTNGSTFRLDYWRTSLKNKITDKIYKIHRIK